MIQKNFWVISSYKTQTYPFFYFSQETNIDLFRGILFRQVKTIRCSEAVYNERKQTSYFIMYSLFFTTTAKKQKTNQKKAFCFKVKVRKIGKYIFLLHNNINSYKRSKCSKRNWMLACIYSLKRQQAIRL